MDPKRNYVKKKQYTSRAESPASADDYKRLSKRAKDTEKKIIIFVLFAEPKGPALPVKC